MKRPKEREGLQRTINGYELGRAYRQYIFEEQEYDIAKELDPGDRLIDDFAQFPGAGQLGLEWLGITPVFSDAGLIQIDYQWDQVIFGLALLGVVGEILWHGGYPEGKTEHDMPEEWMREKFGDAPYEYWKQVCCELGGDDGYYDYSLGYVDTTLEVMLVASYHEYMKMGYSVENTIYRWWMNFKRRMRWDGRLFHRQ